MVVLYACVVCLFLRMCFFTCVVCVSVCGCCVLRICEYWVGAFLFSVCVVCFLRVLCLCLSLFGYVLLIFSVCMHVLCLSV